MPRNTNITYIPRIPDPDGHIPHLFTSSFFSSGFRCCRCVCTGVLLYLNNSVFFVLRSSCDYNMTKYFLKYQLMNLLFSRCYIHQHHFQYCHASCLVAVQPSLAGHTFVFMLNYTIRFFVHFSTPVKTIVTECFIFMIH